MNEPSTREKVINSVLVICLAVVGWFPYIITAYTLPYTVPVLFLISFSLTFITLGTVFDATEYILGRGKGIYATAIFCSVPAVGIVMADPSLLPLSGLMLMVGGGLWMASRAIGEARLFFLSTIAALLLATGYLFSFYAGSLAMIFVIWLAISKEEQKFTAFVVASCLVLCYIAGSLARIPVDLGVPMLLETSESAGRGLIILFSMLPWMFFFVPVLVRFALRRTPLNKLHIAALLTIAAMYVVGWLTNTSLIVLTAVAAPVLAILCSSLVCESFLPSDQVPDRKILFIPAWLTMLALAGFTLYMILQPHDRYPHRIWQILSAVVLIGSLAAVLNKNLPRWILALLMLAGVLCGSISYLKSGLLPSEENPFESLNLANELIPVWVFAAIGLGIWMVVRLLYGRSMPKLAHDGRHYHYDTANLRNFTDLKRQAWAGVPATLNQQNDFRFVIFGDVTGAEFPFSSRNNSYFIYRALARELEQTKPAFAVSLGDLSTKAAELPYRRVRKLLSHIPVPIAVVPGNHDLFYGEEYRIAFFHALFGADNSCFKSGNCKLILLNNARGYLEEEQFQWLEQSLREEPAAYTLLFCHKPPFDFRTDDFYGMENRAHAERLHELLKTYHATAVFSGHIHTLMNEVYDGVTYIISGGAGSKLTTSEDLHHYLEVEVSQGELIIRALALSAKAISEKRVLLELRFDAQSLNYSGRAQGPALPFQISMYIRGSQSFPPPSRILLIQLRRIGDTLLGSPAIRALHQHFPHAKIDFIAESPSEEILRGHPAIDRLLIAPRHSIQQTISFICKVRQQKYDWAIDFMSNPRSAQFAFFSGAKLRVGLDRRGRRWAFTHHVVEEAEDKDAYAVDLRLKILQLLGVPSAGRHMEIFCDQVCLAEKQQAETAIAKLNGKGSIITVATGSGNPAKRYPANLTAQVIETLTQEGCQVVLTSGPGETIYADEILKQLKQPVMHLADARVPLLAALYRKCQLYIGPDSAPKHIAIACGLPTVTIFGPGRPSNWNDAENPRSVMLVAPCDVRPNCVESECARRACLHKIEPQAVVETARILLM